MTATGGRIGYRLAWAAVILGALALWYRAFHAYADTWDGCEYVWAVDQRQLPHAPYVVYLWLGLALARIAPADVALSLLSLLSGLVATLLVASLVRRESGSEGAALGAAAVFAAFPVSVWFSGVQEVYGPCAAFSLAACHVADREGRARAAGGGLLYGAALATHQGALFLLPAMLLVLWRRGPRLGRLAGALGCAAAVCLGAAAWVAWVFPGPGSLTHYLAGIAPLTRAADLVGGEGVAGPDLLGRMGAALGLPAVLMLGLSVTAIGVLAARGRGALAFWALYALPFLLFEVRLGRNLDPGLYFPFVAPAGAALLATAGTRVGEAWRPTIRRSLLGMTAVLLVVTIGARAAGLGKEVVRREAFLSSDLLQIAVWLRGNLPEDAYVVQPPGLPNGNLLPAYAGRRPIAYRGASFAIFEGGRWAPLNASSFATLDAPRLRALREAGNVVVSLVPAPFSAPAGAAPLTWRERSVPLAGSGPARTASVFFLETGQTGGDLR